MYPDGYEYEDSCRDGCGCDMFCAKEGLNYTARRLDLPESDWYPDYRDNEKLVKLRKKEAPVSNIKCINKNSKKKQGTALGDLDPGETFRFPSGIDANNVYMVISINTRDLLDPNEEQVHYVLLSTGRVYNSRYTKEVMRVDAELAFVDTK